MFEVLRYACLGLCIWHALHQGPLRRARLIELGIGVLYGLTLEILTIVLLHAYQYGHYLIMLGPVSLAVAVGWGIILYSAMAFADSLTFSLWAAPVLAGLLGLNIDLTMDAVTIRLNMLRAAFHILAYGSFGGLFVMCEKAVFEEESSIYIHPDKPLLVFSGKPFESKNSLLQASLIITKCDHG